MSPIKDKSLIAFVPHDCLQVNSVQTRLEKLPRFRVFPCGRLTKSMKSYTEKACPHSFDVDVPRITSSDVKWNSKSDMPKSVQLVSYASFISKK